MGMTSHDCVGAMRRILHERRIGHGGTLDPAAMGVLPLAVGRMTRLLRFLGENKHYRATIRLGVATDTDDLEGTILHQVPAPQLELDQVRSALHAFEGTIEQIPPRFSAIRRDGKRLYELARSGEAPDLEDIPARQVR
ncbi:MAG: tRNA pseudouridine(55) synthase TruB, partial [Gemmatimonadaceae bacterium]|nr:tRNA pseudouridine(55) synthase TruB [Gloeobacterales cyanobacterium ES-bin-141]